MINYRFKNIEVLLVELRKEGVTATDTMQTYNMENLRTSWI